MNYQEMLNDLFEREKICWEMASLFLRNKDAHGLHDAGVEIQALQRAISTLKDLNNDEHNPNDHDL